MLPIWILHSRAAASILETAKENKRWFQLRGPIWFYTHLPKLEEAGLVDSCWEDQHSLYPRRRLYRLTETGAKVAGQMESGSASA